MVIPKSICYTIDHARSILMEKGIGNIALPETKTIAVKQ